jgi:hypothetical protein
MKQVYFQFSKKEATTSTLASPDVPNTIARIP